jgi:adenylate kinase
LLTNDRQYSDPKLFLDGHAMIETTDGPYLVPEWFFDQIKIERIICIVDAPDVIATRRAQQNWTFDIAALSQLQDLERRYAQDQAARLHIPYIEVRGNDISSFANAISATI